VQRRPALRVRREEQSRVARPVVPVRQQELDGLPVAARDRLVERRPARRRVHVALRRAGLREPPHRREVPDRDGVVEGPRERRAPRRGGEGAERAAPLVRRSDGRGRRGPAAPPPPLLEEPAVLVFHGAEERRARGRDGADVLEDEEEDLAQADVLHGLQRAHRRSRTAACSVLMPS